MKIPVLAVKEVSDYFKRTLNARPEAALWHVFAASLLIHVSAFPDYRCVYRQVLDPSDSIVSRKNQKKPEFALLFVSKKVRTADNCP